MTTFSKEVLKSALIELAQSDRAFFVSLIASVMSGTDPIKPPALDDQNEAVPPGEADHQPAKIKPAYRKNIKQLRKRYAMDKATLLKLQNLFNDAPTVEDFLQTDKT